MKKIEEMESLLKDIYLTFISIYIMGDRVKSDSLLKAYKPHIVAYASLMNSRYPIVNKKLYRGIILPPDMDPSQHDIWEYDHVSFTTSKEVAEAFGDINSVYSQFVKSLHPDWIGHVIEHKIDDSNFIWFDHSWAKHIDKDFEEMIILWNQEETLIGKK